MSKSTKEKKTETKTTATVVKDRKAIMLEDVRGVRSRGYGRKELEKFLSGEKITMGQGIKAYCYQCMGFYVDEATDCKDECCPLHPFMPYNEGRQKKKHVVSKKTIDAMVKARKKKEMKKND